MRVETATAAGFGLLDAVRATLASSNDSVLCVAFAHERGERLLGKELEAAPRRGGKARLLVTTSFDRGELTNTTLLNQLRVHRSSAVCAMLAKMPGVIVVPGRTITLRYAPVGRAP